MSTSPVVITARSLTKYYGSHLGIQDVSFQVNQGEIFGFLGPNGAGKTTTIRTLLDLLRPDSGVIELFGLEVRKENFTIRKQIGYLPGEFSVHEHLTGLEFFRLISTIRNVPLDVSAPLFERFDLTARELHKKIKALSHGTLQKLGIIQALLHQPQLLILDEPTNGLDPLMKEVFYEVLLEEQRRGTTIFFSSHNLNEAERLCHRVAIIRKGRIAGVELLAALQEKAGQVVEITLADGDNPLEIPGANLIHRQGNHYTFMFKGDVNAMLKRFSELTVQDISITRPELSGLFMQYYHDTNGKQDVVS